MQCLNMTTSNKFYSKLCQVLHNFSLKKPFVALACDFFVTMVWKFTKKDIEPKVNYQAIVVFLEHIMVD
jgi:hypothetical protein